MKFKAILGLGNTGSKYKNTYHNAGHQMIDFLLEKNNPPKPRAARSGEHFVKRNVLAEKTIITKNVGFMNKSGTTTLKILKKIGGKPENLLVIHDDSDIILGKYKLSIDRSSAGHKGVEDIINKIGSKKFWRLRIGIRPKEEDGKALDFVLKRIKKENKMVLEKVFEESSLILTQPPQQ